MDLEVCELSNEMLIAVLDKRVEFESTNEAEIIDFIREVMLRRLFLEYGADSMFDFLTRAHFHYAPVVAQRKLDAAKLMQLFPEIKERLSCGDLNLTQLGMMASALRQKPTSPKAQSQILELMRGQTIRNTQVILNEALELEVKSQARVRVQRDGSVRVETTFSKEEWEVITRAKEILSHSVPSGELNQVLTHCARYTVDKKDLSTSIKEVRPRQSTGASVSRAVRRLVFRRDKSCRHRHSDGRLCESRYQLQVDHVLSLWLGGGNEVENLQLLCGVHNRYKYQQEVTKP